MASRTSTIPRKWNRISQRWRDKLEKLANIADCEVLKVGSFVIGNNDEFLIGIGNNGTEVFLGLTDDGTEVAVKKMTKRNLPALKNELTLLRLPKLDDPAIVQYVDLAVDNNFFYLALQLCEYTLEEYIKECNPSEMEKKQLAHQVLKGLSILHSQKNPQILHRDIKPQNVLIDIHGKARLADFGISRELVEGKSTRYTSPAGTPCWMAKETLVKRNQRSVPYKRSTDIQVAGMLVYYILSGGYHPFGDDFMSQPNIAQGIYNLDDVQDVVAKHLIEWMIDADPKRRPTVEECLDHSFWLKERSSGLSMKSDRSKGEPLNFSDEPGPSHTQIQSMAAMKIETHSESLPTEDDNSKELVQIQKRTFTNWMNAQLSKRKPPCTLVQNLFIDFCDGSRLLDLLEVMSGERIGRERGSSTFHQRSNIQTALSFLEKKSIKLVNINTPDIINGNPSIILGLIWIIIRQYHIVELASSLSLRPRQSSVESLASLDSHSTSTLSSHSASSSSLPSRSSSLHSHVEIYAKKVLLLWVIEQCLKAGCTLDVKDFKASWRSGEVFLAIIYALRPDLVDLSKTTTRSNKQNLEEAFHTAERELRIPRLLEPDDVDVHDPDEKSIMTYVAQFLQYSRDLPGPEDDMQGGCTDAAVDLETLAYQANMLCKEVLAIDCRPPRTRVVRPLYLDMERDRSDMSKRVCAAQELVLCTKGKLKAREQHLAALRRQLAALSAEEVHQHAD